MINFQRKIEEMQRKLNIINYDIEEIKNGRKSIENKKIKLNKTNAFLKANKRKNFFRDNISNNNNSANFINRQKDGNSFTSVLNLNNTGRTVYQYKNTNFNLTNTNLEEIPKENYYRSNGTNNSFSINNNDIGSKRDLTINYIDNYTKRDREIDYYLIQKYNSSLNTISSNNKNYSINNYGNNLNNKKSETNDYFYKNTLYNNYCHMKKNLNNINLNTNTFTNSQTINDNNYTHRKNKTFNNKTKNINSISSTRKNKKKKMIVDKKAKNKNKENIKNALESNEILKKRINKRKKNSIMFYNNNPSQKFVELNYNSSYNNNNKICDDNDINIKQNQPIKIRTRNNRNINSYMNHSKADYNKIKDKNIIIEDINIKDYRSTSINKHMNDDYNFNKEIKNNENENAYDISHTATDLNNEYPKEEKKLEKNSYNINSPKNKVNHEKILLDIIDITNQYNKENKVNIDNLFEEYKIILNHVKERNEFIYKIINLYNSATNSNLNYNNSKSFITAWKWIKENYKISHNKLKNENENNQYKFLCRQIMKEYNLKNIQQLNMFIHKLCKKVDKNENFLEGIKKILMH